MRSLRPMRLKMVISLSSLRIRRVRKTSFKVEPLVVPSSGKNISFYQSLKNKFLSKTLTDASKGRGTERFTSYAYFADDKHHER